MNNVYGGKMNMGKKNTGFIANNAFRRNCLHPQGIYS